MKKKIVAFSIILIILGVISSCVGRYDLSIATIFQILTGKEVQTMDVTIFYSIRLSRTVLVILSGGALALAGMVYQNLFQNPLVSPDVLGVSSGCSIGAIVSILFTVNHAISMQSLTFLSGMITVLIAMMLARKMKGDPIYSMVIAGIIIGSLASSIIMTLKYTADPERQLAAIEYWLMGSFHTTTWSQVKMITPLVVLATTILYWLKWNIKVLTLGEEEAISLGVPAKRVRMLAIICATVLVSTVVSVAGIVAWIGLIAPHLVRLIGGEDFSKTFVLCFIMGGIVLLLADTIARTVFTAEVPISILTSFIGACFLFYVIMRGRRQP